MNNIIPPSRSMIKIFGIVGLINFIVFFLLWNYLSNEEYSNVPLRLIAAFLCFLLAISDYWPTKTRSYLIPFWYITICYCLPFFGAYMFLVNHSSPAWNSNIIIGLFWLVLITDWLTFIITLVIGSFLGTIYYKLSHGAIHLPSGEVTGIYSNYIWSVVLAVIFSRQKELTLQAQKIDILNILNKKLENALAAKTEFLNNISHEIRTPVHGFTVLSGGLVEHWYNFDETKKLNLAEQVASNAKRLGLFVGNLLDLAKFTNDKIYLHLTTIDLNLLIHDIIEECNSLYLSDKKIEIVFNPINPLLFDIDSERISKVLRNLFFNTIKFTPNNGLIKASAKISNDIFYFTISDSGIGIPSDELESIFEAFTQSSRTKTRAGGTGLGLSICRAIISAHHGKIWAENNKDGQGSRFHFTIPNKSN